MSALWQRGAGELASMIKAGQTTSAEVIEAHLQRIDEVNGSLNAVVKVLADEARAGAATADAAVAAGETIGPLGGVPFTIKENIDLAGHPTTHGLQALAAAIAPVDAPVVERMKAAGAVPLARTNLPDMGLRIHTDNALHGLTRNPWHPDHTAGGSSGGEGSALASGMSPIGLGNDLGGSLRNPASCCSIASIKPTMGRVPGADTYPAPDGSIALQLLAVQGPMARTVTDVRLGLEVLSGWHVRDPHSVPMPIEAPEPGVRRVAIVAEPPGGDTDPRIVEAVRAAGRALEAAGCQVDEVEVPRFEEVVQCWRGIVIGDIVMGLPLLEPIVSADAASFLRQATEMDAPPSLESIGALWMQRQSLMRDWAAFYAEWDVVLTPTWTQLPFRHGADAESFEGTERTLMAARPVMPANVLGLPSAAVPVGVVDGLPVGALVNGPQWGEMKCLEIAEIIEAAGLAPATPMDPITA
ncbi:MAG: indole acetimide hydrolase [Actinomycetia bacterium]|nr:indole acetimide hydrolase [Actinomycetes bacterium]